MKKNISINLFGTLYNIDEDAYNLLESYLQSMQRYFTRQEGGEEVADDIEHRVAELLWQRREAGMTAVNIETVKEIIDTIGNAEQIAGDEGQGTRNNGQEGTGSMGQENSFKENFNQFANEAGRFARDAYDKGRKHVSTHHFYRCEDDKVLGGVCSGAAAYFNTGDALLWRLVAVVSTLLLSVFGIGLVIVAAYIALWLLAPAALTPEDRLRMQGKEITPENLAQQVKEESQQPIIARDHRRVAGGCLKTLLIFLGVIFMFPFLASAICLIMAIVVVAGIGTTFVGSLLGGLEFFPEFTAFVNTCQPLFLMALICGLVVVILPIYGIIRLLRGGKRLSASMLTSLVVIWLFAVGLGIACTVGTCIKADEWSRSERDRVELNHSLNELKAIGWQLKESKNLDERIAEHRTGFAGLPRYAFRLEPDHYDEVTYTAVFEKELNLTEEGEYDFMSLTSDSDAGLTYTFTYRDGGEEKEAVLRPSEAGMHLKTMSWEMINGGYLLPSSNKENESSWMHFSREGEDWVYHWTFATHVDAGKCKLTISARDCSVPVKIRDVKVVKVSKLGE